VISPDKHWYRLSWLSLLLLPLAGLFRLVVAARRSAYRIGLLRSHDAGVPVIVVGNITAGGTGKTPLVIWLCALLRRHGRQPGIVSRGYGGDGRLQAVTPDTDPAMVGEEPVLLALRTACPVWIGRDRAQAARHLLAANPGCDVIVGDDGLQHYALKRQFEIAVVDGQRRLGNGLPLPSGPLREPASRLREVDAVVVNGDTTPAMPGAHAMALEGASFRRLDGGDGMRDADAFRGEAVHAVAGIGNPERFFAHLRRLGMTVVAHPFPDHHAFTPADIDFGDGRAVILTEKDAIKCRRFGRENHWVLAVGANVAPALAERILENLKAPHGFKAP
jgi:tetraacyldisaccharide 4'-kinase